MKNKKMSKKTKPVRRKPEFSEASCPACGTNMKEQTGRLSLPINGEEISVSGISHLHCPKCGEIVLRLDESRKLRESVLEAYRKKYGLLSGDEIRSLRERLDLTQGQLAELLRLGVNTISRWESDRNVQTAAMDILLRIVRDVPGSLDYLRRRVA